MPPNQSIGTILHMAKKSHGDNNTKEYQLMDQIIENIQKYYHKTNFNYNHEVLINDYPCIVIMNKSQFFSQEEYSRMQKYDTN